MATIQGVYVALFGRPADPAGLAYFNSVTNNGADLSKIGDLASTDEYKKRVENKSNVDIISEIYVSLFNRAPEAAGLNFFVDALNKGTLTINNIAIAILDGAQGTDKELLTKKLAEADAFTAALDTPSKQGLYSGTAAAQIGIDYLKTVVDPKGTYDAAGATGVGKLLKGEDVTLTAGNDVVSPTAPTLKTSIKDDTITAAHDTWQAADTIDGAAGTDTINFTNSAAAAYQLTVAKDALKEVEVLNIVDSEAAESSIFNLKEASGLTQVWQGASNGAVTVNDLALGVTVGAKGASGGTVNFNFTGTAGSDAATLNLETATGNGAIAVNGVEVLNVVNSGTSFKSIGGADVTTVNLSGKGELTAVLTAAKATSVVNSSTDKVSVELDAANKLATYTGSDKVDVVFTNLAGNEADVTISTGAGSDIITVNGNSNAAKATTLTGGANSDKFVVATGIANIADVTSAAKIAESLITISDFNKAEDLIDVSAANDRVVLDNFQKGSIASAADLKAALEAAASAINANKSAVFVYGGDTYVFNNDANAALSANDGLVKIAGVTDLADLTASNFVI